MVRTNSRMPTTPVARREVVLPERLKSSKMKGYSSKSDAVNYGVACPLIEVSCFHLQHSNLHETGKSASSIGG